ncbi:DUF488 family protein [Zhihengliuella sp.]|uniref:DUF488 domain-containing protein n=1 Tax=Zhihengliuella sp. TaxID=1954483 RepID=UPI002810D95C|nr:DUF488 family protein [Zhihengliuella sp.]
MGEIRLRRAYDPPDGGYRILVDRLWPRGVSKADLELDEWARDVAPSKELRAWFDHREHRFEEFRERYWTELEDGPAAAALERLLDAIGGHDEVVLVYATRDREHNNAVALLDFLRGSSTTGDLCDGAGDGAHRGAGTGRLNPPASTRPSPASFRKNSPQGPVEPDG